MRIVALLPKQTKINRSLFFFFSYSFLLNYFFLCLHIFLLNFSKKWGVWNPLGKVVERSGLRFEPFFLKNGLKSPRRKGFYVFFFHLFTFEVPFKCLFAPTFQNRMSTFFKDLESLRKILEKKWSQVWTFLLKNGLKSQLQKKNFMNFFPFVHFI